MTLAIYQWQRLGLSKYATMKKCEKRLFYFSHFSCFSHALSRNFQFHRRDPIMGGVYDHLSDPIQACFSIDDTVSFANRFDIFDARLRLTDPLFLIGIKN